MFVNASTNAATKKFYKAKRIEYDTTPDTFNTDSREEWTEIKNISSLKIQLEDHEERKESEIKDIYETSYSPTLENAYVLIRKKDIVSVSVDSSKSLKFLESYDNAAVSIDISKGAAGHLSNLEELQSFGVQTCIGKLFTLILGKNSNFQKEISVNEIYQSIKNVT